MLKVKKYHALGSANHGWLNANFHFSFGDYYNHENMNFGHIRVINDDLIEPDSGFPMHPHENMEIITYVRKGAISHQDNQGNKGVTNAGDVQVMSAGSGIYHTEYNNSSEITNLYQIWIMPNQNNVKPSWAQAEFPKNPVDGRLNLLVSGRKEHANQDALYIHQDAAIYGGRLIQNTSLTHAIKHQAYILISEGEAKIDGEIVAKGDGIEVTQQNEVQLLALSDCEILIIDVPARD